MKQAMFKRFCRDRSGVTAVEFALVAFPLLLLLFGAIEFGRMFWARQALQEVAAATARCAAIPQDACASSSQYDAGRTVTMATTLASANGLALQASNVSVTRSTSCGGLSGFTVATLSYSFSTPVPMIATLLPSAINFQATACYPNQ